MTYSWFTDFKNWLLGRGESFYFLGREYPKTPGKRLKLWDQVIIHPTDSSIIRHKYKAEILSNKWKYFHKGKVFERNEITVVWKDKKGKVNIAKLNEYGFSRLEFYK